MSTRTRTARRALAGTAALALGLTLAACSSDTSSAPSEANRKLDLAISSAVGDLSIGGGIQGDPTLYLSIYDTVVHLGSGGKLEPGIAESWQYSDDRRTLTMKIRDGLTFSNGDTLDASAVAKTLESERKLPATAQTVASISSIEAPDASTLVIKLSKADASILPALSSSVGAVGDPKLLGSADSKLKPVGSGPYVLDTTKSKIGSTYVLTRNAKYWDAKSIDFNQLNVRVISDATAATNALLAGQIDYSGATPDVLPKFQNNPQFTIGKSEPSAIGVLALVDRQGKVVPALKDVRVRQAINLAIDRKEIVSKLLGGQGIVTNQLFTPTKNGFVESLVTDSAYNLSKAKSLMADAGYADGFSMTMPSTVLSTTFDPTIQQALADIGIKVKYETIQYADLYTKVFGGTYGAFFSYAATNTTAAQDANSAVSGLLNPMGQIPSDLQKLLDTANSADDADQGPAFQAVNKYLVDQAWDAPIFASTGNFVTTKDVKYDPTVGYGHITAFSAAD